MRGFSMIEACNLLKGNTNNEKRIGAFFPELTSFVIPDNSKDDLG